MLLQEHAIKSTFEVTDKFATSFDMVEEQLKSSTIGGPRSSKARAFSICVLYKLIKGS